MEKKKLLTWLGLGLAGLVLVAVIGVAGWVVCNSPNREVVGKGIGAGALFATVPFLFFASVGRRSRKPVAKKEKKE